MSIAFGSFDIFSDLLNLCINTSVNIINGKGIRGRTCVKPSAKDWSFKAKIWKIPKFRKVSKKLSSFDQTFEKTQEIELWAGACKSLRNFLKFGRACRPGQTFKSSYQTVGRSGQKF